MEDGTDKDSDFFTRSFSDTSINNAAKKLMNQYKECYFATCDLYFIKPSISQKAIKSIGKEICDSNIFPTTGVILCTQDNSMEDFLKSIKAPDDLHKIKQDTDKHSINAARFFAGYTSGATIVTATISADKKKPKYIGNTAFTMD